MPRKVLLALLCTLLSGVVWGQNVTVSGANASSNGSYSTIAAAFTAINNFSQTSNNISITITGNTSESSSATLNAGTWSSLNIAPSGNRTIQGSISTQLIELNGADKVTIDGLNDGTNSLIIDNTNNTATDGTIKLWRDAQYNKIKNCTIKGSSTNGNSGIIYFSTADAVLLQGNDYNKVYNCILRESSTGNPRFGIYSAGTSGTPIARWNSNDTISNNELINIVNLSISGSIAAGIQLTNNANTDWVISSNSFYFSGGVTSTASANNYGIRITGGSGVNFEITGNYFGGTAASCSGSQMTWTNTGNGNKFCGIEVEVSSSGTGASIQGNTISNILLNTNSNASTTPYIFCGINVVAGQVLIGTTVGNVVGSISTIASITVHTDATGSGAFNVGIGVSGSSSSVSISNNAISGILLSGTVGASSRTTNFRAIFISAGTATITSNAIGSSNSTNSIQVSTGNSSSANAIVAGISQSTSAGNITATGNTILNLTYSGSGNNQYQVIGIHMVTGSNSILSNSISGLYNNNQSTQSDAAASVIGIMDNSTNVTGETISQNTISNLSQTNTGSIAVKLYGIYFGGSGSNHSLTRNLIYDLKVSSTSTSAAIDAIQLFTSNPTISNNMISVGNGLSNNPFINAINLQGGSPKIYYNSVVVTGSASGTAAVTNVIRFQGNSSGTDCRNNIFYNNRTSATPANNCAMFFSNSTQVTNTSTCNNNDLYLNSSNTVLVTVNVTNYASMSLWQAAFGKDANSLSILPTFTDITSDLHLTNCLLAGYGTSLSTTIDYDGSTRNTIPWIGADEPFKTWSGVTGDWNVSTNWSPNGVPASYNDVLITSGTVSLTADATCHSVTISGGATLTANSYKLTLGTSSCINSFFSNSGTFNANSGTVQFDGANSILSGSISGSTATTFNNITLNTGITFPASLLQATINSTLQLNSGSYVGTNSPVYANTSTLTYNTNGSYGVSNEWTSTTDGIAASGRPQNITIINSTVNVPNSNRAMAGDLTINSAGSLVLNNYGGDLFIRGNWSNQGTFVPNNRAVWFTGLADQTITRTGGGTETFPYFIVDMPNTSTYVKPNNSSGNQTDLFISNYQGGYGLQLIDNGGLDLNSRTVTLGSSNYGSIQITGGARSVISSSGTGTFVINGGPAASPLVSSPDASTLSFGSTVIVQLKNGFDFGSNLTTINGMLQILSGSFVYQNAPTYGMGSLLQYYTNGVYNRTVEWGTTSGPGYPYNVQLSNNTTLNPGGSSNNGIVLNLANDLTIDVGSKLYMDYGSNDMTVPLVVGNDIFINGDLSLSEIFGGDIKVGGDWWRNEVTSNFDPNDRAVFLNGSTTQNVTIVNSTSETFDYLIIDNPAEIVLNSIDVNVNDVLTLTNGILSTGNNQVYVMNSASSAIAGYQTVPSLPSYLGSSRVNGNLRRNVLQGGTTGTYDFPIGTSSNYELVSLNMNNISGTNNILGYFNGSSCGAPPNLFVIGTLVNTLLDAGYWTLTPNVQPGGGTYEITARETGYGNPALDDSMYAIIKRTDCSANWYDDGDHDGGTQSTINSIVTAVRSNLDSFSDFAIAYGEFLLPIELTDFSVSLDDNNSIIQWTTISEYNSDYFIVERSLDGIDFNEIAKLNAQGFSTSTNQYEYIDYGISELQAIRIYYRLRMVDIDQSFEYSVVRWIDLNGMTSIIVFPNPFNDELSISVFSTGESNADVELADVTGRIISRNSIQLSKGTNYISSNQLSKSGAGIYFITITYENKQYVFKAVKQ